MSEAELIDELVAALCEAGFTLGIVQMNIAKELKRGVDRWKGVPELLATDIGKIHAAIAKATGEAA